MIKYTQAEIIRKVSEFREARNFKATWQEVEAYEKQLRKENFEGVEVGDGITIHLYSDSHAYTIIRRTEKTLTVQRDIATLDPTFKPEIIQGGFVGHCINQNEQSYTYEADPQGEIIKLHWSDKQNRWVYKYGSVTLGRHEFYDYNF